jgi:hypothetical protein
VIVGAAGVSPSPLETSPTTNRCEAAPTSSAAVPMPVIITITATARPASVWGTMSP